MDKQTKIIATIGPSSDSKETIEELIKLGVNIFRFNFKHSDINWHKERLQRVREVCQKLNVNIATLLDLQGPEIRLKMPFEKIELKDNEEILLSESVFQTNEKGFSLTDNNIIAALNDSQKLLADDGKFEFVVKKSGDQTLLVSRSNGELFNNKSVSVVDLNFNFPTLHEKDKEGLTLANEEKIDFIALSFVRDGDDIKTLREEMQNINLESKIVAKIETHKSIQNIDEIINQSDAIMVARGDLGVELSLEQVPFYQKEIIKKCLEKGVPVITATQMLESMTQNPNPTRAEVSDVANAIFDFTDAIMLSGETANGKYPIESVKIMAKIAKFTEEKNHINDIRSLFNYELIDESEMVCDSAFNLYKSLKLKSKQVKGFITFTQTGKTSRMLSRYRPHVPIYAFSPSEEMSKKLSLNYGVIPVFQNSLKEKSEIVKNDILAAINLLKERFEYKNGDMFIVLHGDYWTSDLGTSTIRLIRA